MTSEATVGRTLLSRIGSVLATLFRTNSGKAWMSSLGPKGVVRLADGSIVIKAPRPVGLGLALANGDTAPGLSDYTGWTIKTIPPEWVGRRVAIFTAVETKRSKGGRVSDNQSNYLGQVHAAGGIAVLANSPEVALDYIKGWNPPSQ